MSKVTTTTQTKQLTAYAQDTLHLLQQATRTHAHLLDMQLSLPNLALLLAAAAHSSFFAALTRLARLFKNPRFAPESLLVHRLAALEQQQRLNGVQIVVDWTRCGRFEVLYAALVLGRNDQRFGRAMLLYARAHRAGHLQGKQNQAEETLLSQIKAAFAAVAAQEGTPNRFAAALFLFDRGFSKDGHLGYLSEHGFRYVVRAKVKVRCLTSKGHSMRLDKYLGRMASGTLVKGVIYKHKAKGRRPRLNALVVRRRVCGTWHTWYLFTNLEAAESAVAAYERRFTIEEAFKDAKTHWHLEQRRFQHADRMDRYLGVLSLIQGHLCEAALWLSSAVAEVGKRLGESGRNRLSLQNRIRRALFLLPDQLQLAMTNSRCI